MAKIFKEILNQLKIFYLIVNPSKKFITLSPRILLQTSLPISDCVAISNRHKIDITHTHKRCLCIYLSTFLNCIILEPTFLIPWKTVYYDMSDVCVLVFDKKNSKLNNVCVHPKDYFFRYVDDDSMKVEDIAYCLSTNNIYSVDSLMDYLFIQLALRYYDLKDFSKKLNYLNLWLL